jgi:hypothetical protein
MRLKLCYYKFEVQTFLPLPPREPAVLQNHRPLPWGNVILLTRDMRPMALLQRDVASLLHKYVTGIII